MSREKKKVIEDPKACAPAFIVTYSDMVTLLLTFFVLLLTLAEEQTEDVRFKAGINSFRAAVTDIGLSGIMFSKSSGPEFQYPKARYATKAGEDKPEERTVDSQSEMLRHVMLDLEKMMDISPSYILGKSKTHAITDVHFEPGSWALNNESKQYLRKYSDQIQEAFGHQSATIYIVGLAGSEISPKDQWRISARRAQEVARFLEDTIPEETTRWQIYSWGAGFGGDWAGVTGLVNKKTDIMITVLTDN